MEPTCITLKPRLDKNNFLYADGIKIGRLVFCGDEIAIEFCDKDFERSVKRGTRFVFIKLNEISRLNPSRDIPSELQENK